MKGERRIFEASEIRSDQADGYTILGGYAILFNSRTNIGPFDEIIEPGAVGPDALKDVPFFVNHDTYGIPMARSRNNNERSTMQLFVDDIGVGFRIRLDTERNANANALASAVEREDISGVSFMMLGVTDKWEDARSEHPLRHIRNIARIGEISAVVWPAYKETSIESRDNSGALDSALESLESAKAAEEAEERERLENERRTAAIEKLEKLQKEVRSNDV